MELSVYGIWREGHSSGKIEKNFEKFSLMRNSKNISNFIGMYNATGPRFSKSQT